MRNIFVDWSGKYPNLCGGEWTITIDGLPVNIPELLKHDHMNTFGTYSEWSFDKGMIEEWDDYEDGKEYVDWIQDNWWLIEEIYRLFHTEPDETCTIAEEVYNAIHEQDWRYGSCGGCI